MLPTLELQVVFEDNHLLVVDKPWGIPTQQDPYSEVSLEEMAKAYIKDKYQKKGNVFLHPVHRLDKPARGLVLFARTSKALSRLNEKMREKKILKYYEAITEGYPPSRKAQLEHYLIHGDHKALLADAKEEGAKLALLNYELIEKKESKAYLRLELITGRYHQIRAQLAAIGCPVLGDVRYGSKKPFELGGIALTHVEMKLQHPITQKSLHFAISSPLCL